jgi:hypothetical protein
VLDVEWEELVGVRAGVGFRDEGVGEFENRQQRSLDRMSELLKQRLVNNISIVSCNLEFVTTILSS